MFSISSSSGFWWLVSFTGLGLLFTAIMALWFRISLNKAVAQRRSTSRELYHSLWAEKDKQIQTEQEE